MRHFLAERGVIIMKESRPMAWVPTTYGAPLQIAGHVVVIVKGRDRQISVGVKFEQAETNTHIGSAAFIDSDEMDEFLGAMNFITSSAAQMAHDARDYTEVQYSTRDDVTVGFYQDGQKQQAFARLGTGSPTMFLSVAELPNLREAVVQAQGHATSRRLAWESR